MILKNSPAYTCGSAFLEGLVSMFEFETSLFLVFSRPFFFCSYLGENTLPLRVIPPTSIILMTLGFIINVLSPTYVVALWFHGTSLVLLNGNDVGKQITRGDSWASYIEYVISRGSSMAKFSSLFARLICTTLWFINYCRNLFSYLHSSREDKHTSQTHELLELFQLWSTFLEWLAYESLHSLPLLSTWLQI